MSTPRTGFGPAGLIIPVLCLLLLAAGCGAPAGPAPAEITSFEPPSGVLQSGEPASASVRVERIKQMTGSTSEIVLVPYSTAYRDPGYEDMERRKPDARRVAALLDWKPELALDDILERVISYVREQRATSVGRP